MKLSQTHFRSLSLFSAALFAISCIVIAIFGFNWSIEFTGGYLYEFINLGSNDIAILRQQLTEQLGSTFNLSSSDQNFILRSASDVSSTLVNLPVEVLDAQYIGSQLSRELKEQGTLALLTALLIVLIYLTFRFEWRFAIAAIVALIHDLAIVLAIVSVFDVSFDLSVVAALLAIIGYSINDSIVVADRLRELMQQEGEERSFVQLIAKTLRSTIGRTLVTSGTTLITICCLWFGAGGSLIGFAITLFVGVLVGSYSSMVIIVWLPVLMGLRADYYQLKEAELAQLREQP